MYGTGGPAAGVSAGGEVLGRVAGAGPVVQARPSQWTLASTFARHDARPGDGSPHSSRGAPSAAAPAPPAGSAATELAGAAPAKLAAVAAATGARGGKSMR